MKKVATRFISSDSAKERGRIVRFSCECPTDCPLLAAGKCIHMAMFERCVYGKAATEIGPTRRAQAYTKFADRAKAEIANMPKVSAYNENDGMAYIGDYVYLP